MPATARLVAAFLFSLSLAASTAEAAGVNHLVPKNYATIGMALKVAASGDTITVSPGTFPECVTITGLSEISVVGKRGAVIDGTGCPAAVTIDLGFDITLKGFALTGAAQGIAVRPDAHDVLINKVTIAGGAPVSTLEVGVAIDSANAVVLENVTISGATLHAVHAASATGTVVKKSTISDGSGDGIRIDLGTNAKIMDNVMHNLLGPAVYFFHEGGSDLTGGAVASLVVSNNILDCPADGIVIGGSSNLIAKNKVVNSGGVGITALPNGSGSIYRKNKVSGSAGAGILAAGSLDTFEKNRVKDSHQDGIAVVGSMNLFTKSNVLNATDSGFTVLPSANRNRFEDCASARAGADGFHVEGSLNTFTQAKASGSGGLDLNDSAGAATTNTYTDCAFKTSNLP